MIKKGVGTFYQIVEIKFHFELSAKAQQHMIALLKGYLNNRYLRENNPNCEL